MSLTMKYFVLKLRSKKPDDPYVHASREAIKTYAKAIEGVEPDFARELMNWRAAEILSETSIFSK